MASSGKWAYVSENSGATRSMWCAARTRLDDHRPQALVNSLVRRESDERDVSRWVVSDRRHRRACSQATDEGGGAVNVMIENLQGAAHGRRWYCRAVLNDSHHKSTRPSQPPPSLLEIFDAGAGCVRAALSGEIDFANATSLQERILAACKERSANMLVLDVAGVVFMDSSGLRALLHLQRELADGDGGLALLSPTAQVRGILTLTGLDRQLPAAQTLAQARELLGATREEDEKQP
jgi:anti-anti-sigma factor